MLSLVLKHGKKWSSISKILGNQRTENAVKNRFNSMIKKEKPILNYLKLKDPTPEELSMMHEDLIYTEVQIIKYLQIKIEQKIDKGFMITQNKEKEEQDRQLLENINSILALIRNLLAKSQLGNASILRV